MFQNVDDASPPQVVIGDGPSSQWSAFNASTRDEETEKFEEIRANMFVQTYAPPNASKDPFFKLAKTTIYTELRGTQHVVADLANAVLGWEGMGHHCTKIEKVRPQKYTITLTVFVLNFMAKLKIRFYSKNNIYAVEIQRSRGDSGTVEKVYQKLASFLRKDFKVTNEYGEEDTAPPPLAIEPYANCFGFDLDDQRDNCMRVPDQATLLPIFDMANMTSQPSLQAEAAQALLQFMEPMGKFDAKAAEALCTDEAFKALDSLMSASALDVEFFTARIIRNLEEIPNKSQEFFSNHPAVKLDRLANFVKPQF